LRFLRQKRKEKKTVILLQQKRLEMSATKWSI